LIKALAKIFVLSLPISEREPEVQNQRSIMLEMNASGHLKLFAWVWLFN